MTQKTEQQAPSFAPVQWVRTAFVCWFPEESGCGRPYAAASRPNIQIFIFIFLSLQLQTPPFD